MKMDELKQMARRLLATGICLVLAGPVIASVTLTDGDALFHVENGSGADFEPDGTTDHLFQHTWYYRLAGAGSETRLGAPDTEVAVDNQATLSWSLAGFDLQLDLMLSDGAQPGQASVAETMTITNTSGALLDLALFSYADFDVGNTSAEDSATLLSADTMEITDGDFVRFIGSDSDAYQVAPFNFLWSLLEDAAVTNLDNSGLPFGPGDFTGAFQWDVSMARSASVIVHEELHVNIPEPGSLALLALGGLALLRRRRVG